MRAASFLLILSIPFFALKAEEVSLQREDSSSCVLFFEPLDQGTFPILLLISGSQKESSKRLLDEMKTFCLEQNICPLTLEKRGIEKGAIHEKEFIEHLCLLERKKDHELLFQALENQLIPSWNGEMLILGQGDGGRIGAELLKMGKKTRAIALLGSGGSLAPLAEVLYSFRMQMAKEGFSPQYIQGFLVQAKEEFKQALKYPKSSKKAFGYSYKYWDSLSKTDLCQSLKNAHCPIYLVAASQDERIPIDSVDELASLLKGKVKYRREASDRSLFQKRSTYEEAILWLKGSLPGH